MIPYKDFINKANATLTIFDVDDTLFHTSAKIQVKNGARIAIYPNKLMATRGSLVVVKIKK